MKKIILSYLVICCFCQTINAQTYQQEISKFQTELNEDFLNPEKSPLTKKERKKFKGHNFFPVDEKFVIEAKFVRSDDSVPFIMKTTTDRTPTYEKYGEAIFELEGKKYKLNIYSIKVIS